MTAERVQDDGHLRRYFTILPNVVYDDERLDSYGVHLLGLYKRIAGEDGICNASNETVATRSRMSRATVIRTRAKLVELGYITEEKRDGFPTVIRVVNIWDRNMAAYSEIKGGVSHSNTPSERGRLSQRQGGVSHSNTKKNAPNNAAGKIPDARSRDPIAAGSREGDAISENVGSGGEKATTARRGGDMDAFGRALLAQRLNPRTLDAIAEHADVKVEGMLLRVECRDEQLFRELTREPTRSMVNNAAEEAGYAVNRIVRAVA